jgi:hypothetical protein
VEVATSVLHWQREPRSVRPIEKKPEHGRQRQSQATDPERDVIKESDIVMSKSATTATGNAPVRATGHNRAPRVAWSFPVFFGRTRVLEEQAKRKIGT